MCVCICLYDERCGNDGNKNVRNKTFNLEIIQWLISEPQGAPFDLVFMSTRVNCVSLFIYTREKKCDKIYYILIIHYLIANTIPHKLLADVFSFLIFSM